MSQQQRQTLGGILVVAVLLVLGIWVFNRLDESQRAQACLESGGKRCAGLERDGTTKR